MKRFFGSKVVNSIICIMVVLSMFLQIGMSAFAQDVLIDADELEDYYYCETLDFPVFDNDYDYSRGGSTSTDEEYLDYKATISERVTFADMVNHSSEVAAVRLTEMGVFGEEENFYPDDNMTVLEFLRLFLTVCSRDIGKKGSDTLVRAYINNTNLFEEGVRIDYNATLTNEVLAYILGRATKNAENTEQYIMAVDDYGEIDSNYADEVLKTIALGITEIEDFKFNPKAAATKSLVADSLYRLINTGARVIPLFDIGDSYVEGQNEYIVKSTYEANEGGTQFGFFTNYNKQKYAFQNFGKLPIDRNDFHKWAKIETEEGVYNMPQFNNEKISHLMGNTVINCIDISANLNWNSEFGESNIPAFYQQDITNSETRAAAKRFLYAFVQEMLTKIKGNVILAIDYELDWQQAIYNNEGGRRRAKLFSEWFVEACEVARNAASDMESADRLELIVIYNNITNTHLLGVSQNQWMLDMAEVVDYIGIDTYNFYADQTDPSYTIQNIRFLMNNYSLGKPVMVVENGLGVLRDSNAIDEVTGLKQSELAKQYYENLFREFRFCLEKGQFLNANLCAFLIWSYRDTNTTSEKTYGIANDDGSLRDSGVAIQNGISLMYKQKQFNPSMLSSVAKVENTAEINVTNGTKYDKLTFIKKDVATKCEAQLKVELDTAANVYITVNGKDKYTNNVSATVHTIDISQLRQGTNVIDIYFGAEQMPFEAQVTNVMLTVYDVGEWEEIYKLPYSNSLINGKTPIKIVDSYSKEPSTESATGGASLALWTNNSVKDDVYQLRMGNAESMMITYDLGENCVVKEMALSGGSSTKPRPTMWQAFISDNAEDLFDAENCIANVVGEYALKSTIEYVKFNFDAEGRYFGIKLIDNGDETDNRAYISEISVYGLTQSSLELGDCNVDGTVDLKDLVRMKKYIAGMNVYINAKAADFNADGVVNGSDLVSFRKYFLS